MANQGPPHADGLEVDRILTTEQVEDQKAVFRSLATVIGQGEAVLLVGAIGASGGRSRWSSRIRRPCRSIGGRSGR